MWLKAGTRSNLTGNLLKPKLQPCYRVSRLIHSSSVMKWFHLTPPIGSFGTLPTRGATCHIGFKLDMKLTCNWKGDIHQENEWLFAVEKTQQNCNICIDVPLNASTLPGDMFIWHAVSHPLLSSAYISPSPQTIWIPSWQLLSRSTPPLLHQPVYFVFRAIRQTMSWAASLIVSVLECS